MNSLFCCCFFFGYRNKQNDAFWYYSFNFFPIITYLSYPIWYSYRYFSMLCSWISFEWIRFVGKPQFTLTKDSLLFWAFRKQDFAFSNMWINDWFIHNNYWLCMLLYTLKFRIWNFVWFSRKFNTEMWAYSSIIIIVYRYSSFDISKNIKPHEQ